MCFGSVIRRPQHIINNYFVCFFRFLFFCLERVRERDYSFVRNVTQSSIKALSRSVHNECIAVCVSDNNNNIANLFFRMSEEFFTYTHTTARIITMRAMRCAYNNACHKCFGIIIQFHAHNNTDGIEHRTENKICNKIVDAEVFARTPFGQWFVGFSCTHTRAVGFYLFFFIFRRVIQTDHPNNKNKPNTMEYPISFTLYAKCAHLPFPF